MTSLQSARGRRLTTTWPLPSHLQDVVMGLPHSHVKIGLFRRSCAPDPSSAALVLRFEASRGRRGTEKQVGAAAQANAKKRVQRARRREC